MLFSKIRKSDNTN